MLMHRCNLFSHSRKTVSGFARGTALVMSDSLGQFICGFKGTAGEFTLQCSGEKEIGGFEVRSERWMRATIGFSSPV
jgi:hypothetical protein